MLMSPSWGPLQVDEKGKIANWAVPGKNIIGVGGAMDLLVGARKVIVTMNHTSKNGAIKLLKECTYPLTSTRSVDMIITDLAVFEVKSETLVLKELMPGVTLGELRECTEAHFVKRCSSFKGYIKRLTVRISKRGVGTMISC